METNDQEFLEKIKKNIKTFNEYWKDNSKRFNNFMRFINYSTISDDDASKLRVLNKPIIAGNVVHAINERKIFEFAQNPPSISLRRNDAVLPGDPEAPTDEQIEFLEGYLREILTSPQTADFAVPVFSDTSNGGFSSIYIYTDYPNERAWHQDIYIKKAYNPCMVGYDPSAQEPHKGDGEYCFEVVFLTEEEFEQKYGKSLKAKKAFSNSGEALQGYEWNFESNSTKVAAVAIYYYKEHYRERLYLLANGKTVNKKQLDELMLQYESDLLGMTEPPTVLKDEMRDLVRIKCCHVSEDEILLHETTPYVYLPWVFVDGNSKLIENASWVGYMQVTLPALYHAYGPQKLLDFCMQTAGNEIENMVQTKFKMPIESLPDDERMIEAYTNPQQASVYLYKSQNDKMPDKDLAGPQEVARVPTPSIVMESWNMSLQMIQQCAGTYDFNQQLDARTSGKAILQGSLEKGMAAEAYYRNFRTALTQVAEIVLSLIPIYYDSPRMLPMKDMDGNRKYVSVNDKRDPDSIMLNFTPEKLKVVIEAGPSISAQRQMAMQEMHDFASMAPNFSQFLSAKCGDILISNFDIKEKDVMKERWKEWTESTENSQQQMQQMQMQFEIAMKQAQIQNEQASAAKANAEAQSKMMDTQNAAERARNAEVKEIAEMFMKEQEMQNKQELETARLALESQRVETEALSAKYAILQRDVETLLRAREIAAENARTAVEGAIKASEHHHSKNMDIEKLKHEIKMSDKQREERKGESI